MSINETSVHTALATFLASKDFRAGILTSTRAKRQKSSYVVELMPNGHYRVLMGAQIGNKKDVPDHVFLDLPTLEDKDLTLWRGNEESYFNTQFDAKKEELAKQLQAQLATSLK